MSVIETLASDAEREGVADRLRAAAAEGRLTTDELGERLERTYAARTHGELELVVAGLPGPTAPVPRVRSEVSRRLTRQALYFAPPVVICVLVWAFSGAQGGFWPKWVVLVAVVRMLFTARALLLRPSAPPPPDR